MDQFKAAEEKYKRRAAAVARSKGISTLERIANTTTLLSGESENVSPSVLQLRKADLARPLKPQPKDESPSGLPAENAEIEIVVREPRGEFRCRIIVPQIGGLFGVENRHARGYLELFNRGLAYALCGEMR